MCKNTYAFVYINPCFTLCYILDGKVVGDMINFRVFWSLFGEERNQNNRGEESGRFLRLT